MESFTNPDLREMPNITNEKSCGNILCLLQSGMNSSSFSSKTAKNSSSFRYDKRKEQSRTFLQPDFNHLSVQNGEIVDLHSLNEPFLSESYQRHENQATAFRVDGEAQSEDRYLSMILDFYAAAVI